MAQECEASQRLWPCADLDLRGASGGIRVRGTRLVVQSLCDFRLVGRGPL